MKVVVLTGAGISAESGIRTFRAEDGLWEDHSVEDVATPEGFQRNPKLVQKFYNDRRAKLFEPQIQPNAAHLALAKLEQELGKNMLVITQNVDNLHERAGTKNLIHMHGELLQVRCTRSGKIYPWQKDVSEEDRCRCCQPPQPLRPNIVWFGEMPFEMDRIFDALSECDYFISIGTSSNVYPAANFVREADFNGAETVELNLEPSKKHNNFKEKHYGPASKVVPEFVAQLLQQIKA